MWAIILHGGAKEISRAQAEPNRKGCAKALEAGVAVLRRGGAATDAVEAAIRVLEDDPTFNAGIGSALNRDGEVEMCAALMEGSTFNVGAVAVATGVRHPISVAKALLREETVLLGGPGALRFAQEKGLELWQTETQSAAPRRREANLVHDTVGCCALDATGCLAVGTSTGGIEGSRPGRVGDSPQPGCGYYADDAIGAVAFSGDGEHIARKITAARVILEWDDERLSSTLKNALAEVSAAGGEAGGIALTPHGRFAWEHTSRDFAVAYASSEEPEPSIFLGKSEEMR